jgi:hypothetical protein
MMKLSEIYASPYLLINILTGMAIIAIIAIPAVFSSGNYPVECAHVTYSGAECSSCGLSRSFTEMTRGNFTGAAGYNTNGPWLFGFFTLQLAMRFVSGFMIWRSGGRSIPYIVVTDITLSALLFLICFRYLLIFWQ